MIICFGECFYTKKLNTLTIFLLLIITIYIVAENFIIKINFCQFESVSSEIVYQSSFKDSITKEKCDSIFSNLYKLHSAIGSQYPKNNYSLYDSNLYKSFNSERLDRVQINNVWLVDSDFVDIKSESNNVNINAFVSINNIMEVMEFISSSNYYDSSYLNHQALIQMLNKHLNSNELPNKKIVSFGLYQKDYVPWIETILFKMNNQSKLKI